MSRHTCHAYQCERRVPRKMFMCRQHWYSLPKPYRDSIWRHYRTGQESGTGITDEYANTAKRCIQLIAEKEGIEVPCDAPELLVYDLTARPEEPEQ